MTIQEMAIAMMLVLSVSAYAVVSGMMEIAKYIGLHVGAAL